MANFSVLTLTQQDYQIFLLVFRNEMKCARSRLFRAAMNHPPVERLDEAAYLPLDFKPRSAVALAFIAGLASEVEMLGGRRHVRRSEARRDAFHKAVGALIGCLLVNWYSASVAAGSNAADPGADKPPPPGRMSYRPRAKGSFTAEEVPFRQFEVALKALQAAGHVDIVPGHQQFLGRKHDPGRCIGRSRTFRLWPTQQLLQVMAAAGIEATDLRQHFRRQGTAKGPEVEIRSLKEWQAGVKRKGKLRALPRGPATRQIIDEVKAMNAFIAGHRIEVAGSEETIRLYRCFSIDHGLHGRWYARGEIYQGLPGNERAGSIIIDGQACAELDVCASHLTCLYGHLGVPFDAQLDAYTLPDLPRPVVKAWITATLGRGQALSGPAWPRQAVKTAWEKSELHLPAFPVVEVGRAVLARHPVLTDLPGRLEKLGPEP